MKEAWIGKSFCSIWKKPNVNCRICKVENIKNTGADERVELFSIKYENKTER